MVSILLCLFLLSSGLNAEETTEKTLLKRLVSRIPNSNVSLTRLAERLGEGLKEAVNKMPESNSSLVKLADRVDLGVKKMVDNIRPSSDTLHALGERVMDGIRGLAAFLPVPRSDKEAETSDKKKPFALDIKIPHIFSLQLSRSKGDGGRLGISVLRPLLDLNINRRRNKDKDEGVDRKEDKKETDLVEKDIKEESNETVPPKKEEK